MLEILEEVMDYRPKAAVMLNLIQNITALLVETRVKKECTMEIPGRYVDLRTLFPPFFKRKSQLGFELGLQHYRSFRSYYSPSCLQTFQS